MNLVRQAVSGFLHLIYPPLCGVCGRLLSEQEAHICGDCRAGLTGDDAEVCPRCAGTVGPFANTKGGCASCRGRKFHFECAYRLGPYAGVLRETILRMKYAEGEELAHWVAQVWAEKLAPELQNLGADVVLAVPLHWRRRWMRGYNQSEVLAEELARRLRLQCRSRWLRRIRNTPQQTQPTAAARWDNMRGAFRARSASGLRNATCILVDDVLTTGSTCSDAARALREGGAVRVIVAVLARSEI